MRGNRKNDDLNSIKINNTNNISIREQKFINDISLLDFDISLKKEFTNYWTEQNQSKTKMRFELEKTWNTLARIQRWKKNISKWNTKKPGSKLKDKLDTYSKARQMINQINNQ